MMHDVKRLVLDANIMISALLGKSYPFLLRLVENDVLLLTTSRQLEEARNILGSRPKSTAAWAERQLDKITAIVALLPDDMLEKHESAARSRLHERGQPDWPVIAALLESDAAIWSHDKDFFGSGAPVWSTRILRKQLEHAGV